VSLISDERISASIFLFWNIVISMFERQRKFVWQCRWCWCCYTLCHFIDEIFYSMKIWGLLFRLQFFFLFWLDWKDAAYDWTRIFFSISRHFDLFLTRVCDVRIYNCPFFCCFPLDGEMCYSVYAFVIRNGSISLCLSFLL
jgi:hypothetical protein